jgi:hypothetical protein
MRLRPSTAQRIEVPTGIWLPVPDGFLNIQFGTVRLLSISSGVHTVEELGTIRCDQSKLLKVRAVAVGEGYTTWMTLTFEDGKFEFYKRDIHFWELVSGL